MAEKPRLGFGGLWNISFGFFGIQVGFVLQNSNMSRIFQTLGASLDDLPVLWVAAPLTGLIVQPIIGYFSDKTWNGLGRRRPYFLTGAILAALSLLLMPLAPTFAAPLIFAALLLWVLDASLNITMEPFRAFVGDMLPKSQHSLGYGVQTAFIGAGAVFAAIFPWLLGQLGVSNIGAAGQIPDTVKWSFWAGGIALCVAVGWTIVTTKEYSPEEMASFDGADAAQHGGASVSALASKSYLNAIVWLVAAAAVIAIVEPLKLEKEIYLLGSLLASYGLLSAVAIAMAKQGRSANMLSTIVGDFSGMPPIMKRLAVVQFFSWSTLFIMWIYSGPVISQYYFGSADATTKAYNDGASWWNFVYTLQNAVAVFAALFLLPWMSKKMGKVRTHAISLFIGSLGFLGYFLARDANILILCEVAKGIAWASMLAMPYAILASSLPQTKLGTYMGLFNIFIVVPQLLVATLMGSIMVRFFPGDPIWTMLFAAASWAIAGLAMLRLAPESDDKTA
ncbi:MFS transporter [Sphingorhabdus arenilitoris]|uniref:MFS transporter n=1 Tax=Sphingorhabdus arenilitoris TaxID=1490041 RepID=A0ABV8RK17_9SPHN